MTRDELLWETAGGAMPPPLADAVEEVLLSLADAEAKLAEAQQFIQDAAEQQVERNKEFQGLSDRLAEAERERDEARAGWRLAGRDYMRQDAAILLEQRDAAWAEKGAAEAREKALREALMLCDGLLRHLYTVGPRGERWALHPDSPPPAKVLEAVAAALAIPPAQGKAPEPEWPEPEWNECDHCGVLSDARYCSSACRRAAESDRA